MSRLPAIASRFPARAPDDPAWIQGPATGQKKMPEIETSPRMLSRNGAKAASGQQLPATVRQPRSVNTAPGSDIEQVKLPLRDARALLPSAAGKDAVGEIASAIFKEVRQAYSNGLKSSNKMYSIGINKDNNINGKNKNDVQRVIAAAGVVETIQDQNDNRGLNPVRPVGGNKLVIEAANCTELASAAAKLATDKGMHAEVWAFSEADHAFAVIGKPPSDTSIDFAGWKDVWIVDPWMNIACKAPEYTKKATEKMYKWHADGKVIMRSNDGGEQLAIDKEWLRGINSGGAESMVAPSADMPDPWIDFTTAVDYRRFVIDQDLDKPPLRIGEKDVLRTELFDMGAVLDGKSIGFDGLDLDGSYGAVDRLNFDEGILRQRIIEAGKSGDADSVQRIVDIMAEVGANRTPAAQGALLVNSGGEMPLISSELNQQLEKFRGLNSKMTGAAGGGNPGTLFMPGKTAITWNNVGAGMQAFSAYNGLRGMVDAISRGDSTEAAISAAGVGAQGASFLAEAGVNSLGKAFQKGGSVALNRFASTSFGKALGGTANLGKNLSRGAGVAGGVISLPFDIYSSVQSFKKAGETEGKTSQDHYVDGGIAVAGTVTSVATIGASAAGLSAAGPAGIVAAGLLIGGSRIYHSVRYVEDLEEHTKLSGWEKLGTGVSAFFGGSASQEIEDRIAIGKAEKAYTAEKRTQAEEFMAKNPRYGGVIFGDAKITPTPPLRWGSGGMGGHATGAIQYPPTVRGNAAPDIIDARNGLDGLSNAFQGQQNQQGDILWDTGAGDDMLHGVADRKNRFVLAEGKKNVVGGRKDDVLEVSVLPGDRSTLEGGEGSDTLALNFPQDPRESAVRVALSRTVGQQDSDAGAHVLPGSLKASGSEGIQVGTIENVSTSKTARTFVTGNEQDNVIVLNGNSDGAEGGSGNDTYLINGGGVVDIVAGNGDNRYKVASAAGAVNVISPCGDGTHEFTVDYDISDIVRRAVQNGDKLEISLDKTQPQKKIVVSHVFTKNAAGEVVPAKKEGGVVIRTRDGFLLTPTLSSVRESQDGLLHFGIMYAPA